MNINRIKKNIKKVEEIVENIDAQDIINRMEIDKENSIEEDIILLKDFTEGNFKRDKLENYKGSYKMGYFYYKDIQQAIDHILSDYKRVLKENKELEEINNELEAEKNEAIRRYNFETIPIKKVKDKIEELNKAYEDSKDENGESEYYYPDYTIRVLEELLESE